MSAAELVLLGAAFTAGGVNAVAGGGSLVSFPAPPAATWMPPASATSGCTSGTASRLRMRSPAQITVRLTVATRCHLVAQLECWVAARSGGEAGGEVSGAWAVDGEG